MPKSTQYRAFISEPVSYIVSKLQNTLGLVIETNILTREQINL